MLYQVTIYEIFDSLRKYYCIFWDRADNKKVLRDARPSLPAELKLYTISTRLYDS